MNLVWITLHGYRRFENLSKMNVDGKLVAIVGPNEAGKSSFLNALMHLNTPDPFVRVGGSPELSRGAEIPEDQRVIEARFLLDSTDRDSISHLHGAENVRWLVVIKQAKGGFVAAAEPRPRRDIRKREQATLALKAALNDLVFMAETQTESLYSVSELEALISGLDVDVETLSDDVIESIKSFAAKFAGQSGLPEVHRLLSEELTSLYEHEKAESPHTTAMRILFERRPRLLLFGDDARLLQSEYALDQIGTSAPTALRNLARLGGLNLETLKKAITEEDHGHVETLVESANRQLGQIISETWTQSGITVRLRLDGTVLRILTGRSGTRYVSIAERSDGLRQFIALLCFAALEQGGQGSILLIDEAETHLHYDAQADLVQMFARQAVVAKVIYTTHSIGCLPEDLGTGVRLIEPSGPDRSTIRNWFWEDERSGFSPLLFGMGASTLAFVPVRFAILTEGVTDIILLPTLLREATGRSYLGFQIAPGLSRASEDEIALLEHEAPRTAYLVDSDAGGDEICKKLRRARIPDVRILRLSDSENQGLVVEDLIDADAYLAAVNEELRRSHGSSVSLSAAELTEIARPTAVRTWCKSNGVDPPNKRAVAYGLLELRGERRLLAEQRQALLEQLYLNIINALKFPQSA